MNIVITGASQGIGKAAAIKFCRNPENQVFALARNGEKLNQLENEVKSISPSLKIRPLVFDLSKPDFTKLNDVIQKAGNNIDILINNAGLLISKPFENLTDDDWQNLYETNIFGPARLIRHLLPYMGKKTKGHILNISSMGGFQGSVKFPGLSAYSSGKAAIASLTECLALEFQDRNIAVNCLAIGAVQTEMLSKQFPGYKAPLTSEEMAAYIYDFSLNGHKFYNGKILPVALSTP